MTINQESLDKLQQVLSQQDLASQRDEIQALSAQLDTDLLSCAAALLYLQQNTGLKQAGFMPVAQAEQKPAALNHNLLGIKMLRYRLEVGANHEITAEQLKKLLVDESGVDSNNINNINIRADYTIIELPDEMPLDIYQHLKLVEFNQQPLSIKRLKNRNKKRQNNRYRRGRQRNPSGTGQTTVNGQTET